MRSCSSSTRWAVTLGCIAACIGWVSTAHAQRTTGYRMVGTAGSRELLGFYGLGVALSRPLTREVHAEIELSDQRMVTFQDPDGTYVDERITYGPGRFSTLLAGLDARLPVRGHSSPYLRGALGVGLLRTPDKHVDATWITRPGEYDVRGSRYVGAVARLGMGFGQLPCKGLGWEVGGHLTQFASANHTMTILGVETGFVY